MVSNIKDGKKRKLQIVKKSGSKYTVVDPETKSIEDVDEKDIAIDPDTKP
jgi:hypothetical protein